MSSDDVELRVSCFEVCTVLDRDEDISASVQQPETKSKANGAVTRKIFPIIPKSLHDLRGKITMREGEVQAEIISGVMVRTNDIRLHQTASSSEAVGQTK